MAPYFDPLHGVLRRLRQDGEGGGRYAGGAEELAGLDHVATPEKWIGACSLGATPRRLQLLPTNAPMDRTKAGAQATNGPAPDKLTSRRQSALK
jgi:hypothetical protein